MSDEKDTPKADVPKAKTPTAVELLSAAADLLDKQQGPRAGKHYRQLAEQVRQLAARI